MTKEEYIDGLLKYGYQQVKDELDNQILFVKPVGYYVFYVGFMSNNKVAFYYSLYLNSKDEVCLAGVRIDSFTHLNSNYVSMLISNAEHVISKDNDRYIKDINRNPKFLETYEYRWLDMYYTHSQKIRNNK
jgi:hypothetical protein